MRKTIGIPLDSKFILSIGELNKNKNHETVIRAIANIDDKSVHYAIAGNGDLHDYLMKLANELGIAERVHLLGYRSDVVDLYRETDLYIHPSLREGLPVALMEAMASGLPCVVSDIRGNIDLIDDGKGGFLCKPNDVNGFAQKIKMLLSDRDLSTSMSIYNINKLKKYDISAINIQMKKIYQKAAKN